MSHWPPRLALETILSEIEEHARRAPENSEARFFRACILWELGRSEEAEQEYREVLRREPMHFGALTKLGIALRSSGLALEARELFEEAVRQHPQNPVGYVNLANALALVDSASAREHYETALRLKPDLAEAHQGLSSLLALLGEDEAAKRHRAIGFKGRSIATLRYRGAQKPIPVLLLRSTTGGNIDASALLDDRTFLIFEVFLDAHEPNAPLPSHQLVVNGIGDADRGFEALVAAEALRTAAPIVNPPSAVLATKRDESSRRFADVPGVIVPKIALLPHRVLSGPQAQDVLEEHGFRYPFLMRSPGHHLGQHFLKVDAADRLVESVKRLPGRELYVVEYLDARWPDGYVRKYRVMCIGGKLYPAHLAIARDWKVHYFSACTLESEEHRIEEQRFLTHMPEVLGADVMAALSGIATSLGLDYAGIDFGLNVAGDVVFFEANAAMTVYMPPDDERSAYRVAPVKRILAEARAMIFNRIGIAPP